MPDRKSSSSGRSSNRSSSNRSERGGRSSSDRESSRSSAPVNVKIKLGSKEYEISEITTTDPASFIIKETEIIGGGSIKVKGSIEIDSQHFNDFVNKLNSVTS